MGHNSRHGFFCLGQELLLAFAALIDLTSNADNSPTHFASLKPVDDLLVYQGFMMPINHQAGYKVLKTMLKILVDRAAMLHISFLSEWYLL